jgi:DegV family protein with EDD domain
MIPANPELSGRTQPGDTQPKRSVAIVTDSATALPTEVTRALDVQVAQMEITVNGKTFVDGPGGGLEDFYTLLQTSDTIPTTSAPRPGTWLDAFKRAATKAEQIFCITLSSSLSAAYDAARVAAELAESELPGVKITVFDSRSAAGSQALLVLECARMARRGASLEKIEVRAQSLVENLRLLAYLDTLEYIHRGGRVPRIAVWVTNLLNIKPVLEFSAGKIGGIARPRSRSGAFKKLVKEATRDLQGKRAHINVMHAHAADEAEELLRVLDDRLECAEIFLTQFHPFMGTHTGPGLVGVSYWGE